MSNAKTGILTIINSSCNTIVRNIFVGKRAFKIAAIDNNRVCVACDRSNSISVVDCLSYDVKIIDIPNDGNMEIDKLNKKMFISNTSEIIKYDLSTEKVISYIGGFSGITALKLNEDTSKLYVLDKLLSEFRIYSTVNSKLIYSIKNLGINPGFFLISKDDKTAYISMGNHDHSINNYDILKLDIQTQKLRSLDLPKGSIIAGMALNGNTLYAANRGLNRIELINIETYKAYGFILTSMPKPNRLCITDDETKLLVVNRNDGGKGSLDIIDTTTNLIIGRVLMDSQDSQPYDVASFYLSLPEITNLPVSITDLRLTKKPLIIITKKVFACYHENIDFSNIAISLAGVNNLSYVLEKLKFNNGVIVKGSEVRTSIDEMPGFSRIQFILRITYIIYCRDNNDNKQRFEGFLENNQDIIVTMPKERDVDEFELMLKTTTKLINTPSIIDNVLRFGVTTFLELKIIGEDEISMKAFQNSGRWPDLEEDLDNIEEHFETFLGSSGSIFPEGTVFPYLDEIND